MKYRLLIFALLCFADVKAQWADDIESWHNIGLSYHPNKDLSITGKYILGNAYNMSEFKRSYFSLQIDNDFTKWFRLGFEYRFATSYEEDFHRFWLYAVFEHKLTKKWEIQYRPLLQYDVTYFDKEYITYHPIYAVTRNMLRLKYRYNKKIQFYGYGDAYHEWKKGETRWYRMRYGIGGSYLLKKRHDLGIEYVYIDEFNKKTPWDVTFLNFKYIYNIFQKKKGKKDPTPTPIY